MSCGSGVPVPAAGPPGLACRSEVFQAVGSADSLTRTGLASRAPCRSTPLDSLPSVVTFGLLEKSDREAALMLSVLRSAPYCHRTVVEGCVVG